MNNHIHPVTKEVNKRQIELSNKAKIEALDWLAKTFPEVFNTENRVRPLKKGIMDDIFAYLDDNPEPTLSRSKLREAVVMFSRRMEYLVCLKCRNDRVDLNGNFASEVTLEESEMAMKKIKTYMHDFQERSNRANNNFRKEPRKASFESSDATSKQIVKETSSSSLHGGATLVAASGSACTPQGVQTQVTIKRKIAKRIDPEAVARMKEKLGISKKETA